MNLANMHSYLEKVQIPKESANLMDGALRLIDIVCYSAAEEIGDIDWTAFTFREALEAIEHIIYYTPDEAVYMDEDEPINRENLLTEINRVAHFHKLVGEIKPVNRVKPKLI